ncbi:MAG: SDR family NAD(P)-dependent oxidoreductase [Parvibaculaceae bacterium]
MKRQLVVVTGAAGAAGRAIANQLRDNGFYVVGVDTVGQPAEAGVLDDFVAAVDLTKLESADKCYAEIAKKHGLIAGLVNVAGGFAWETVEEGSVETWETMWNVNLLTCLHSCRSALKHFSRNGGTITNVGAAGAQRADVGMAAYAASKYAVARLTEALARELRPRNIRVNAVLPTIIDTPSNRDSMPDGKPEDWVKPDELAHIVSFLGSPKASAINGALLPVAGRL